MYRTSAGVVCSSCKAQVPDAQASRLGLQSIGAVAAALCSIALLSTLWTSFLAGPVPLQAVLNYTLVGGAAGAVAVALGIHVAMSQGSPIGTFVIARTVAAAGAVLGLLSIVGFAPAFF